MSKMLNKYVPSTTSPDDADAVYCIDDNLVDGYILNTLCLTEKKGIPF